MSEDQAVAESVTSSDVPVAVDPSQLNKPVMPQAESGSADSELLKHKLGLANSHAKAAKKEAEETRAELEALRKELSDAKALQHTAAQKSLEDQGQFRQLWEEAKKTVAEKEQVILNLEAQLSSVTQERKNDQLRAAALSQINTAARS